MKMLYVNISKASTGIVLSEVPTGIVPLKKLLSKTSQNSQENACVTVFF